LSNEKQAAEEAAAEASMTYEEKLSDLAAQSRAYEDRAHALELEQNRLNAHTINGLRNSKKQVDEQIEELRAKTERFDTQFDLAEAADAAAHSSDVRDKSSAGVLDAYNSDLQLYDETEYFANTGNDIVWLLDKKTGDKVAVYVDENGNKRYSSIYFTKDGKIRTLKDDYNVDRTSVDLTTPEEAAADAELNAARNAQPFEFANS